MSDTTVFPQGAAPAYSEAEKGTLETPQLAYPKDEKKALYLDEKKGALDVAALPVPELKKDSAARPSKPTPKPKKKASKWILWQLWYNTYRKLFTITFTLNMIGLGLAASGHWPYAIKYNGAMAVANFNFAILMRNEIFGRLLYLFVNTCFAKWAPLKWRLGCTSVLQHLGGIHSGCATSGIAWLILKVVNVYRSRSTENPSVIVLGTITNVAVFLTALAAIPWVRNTHHNVFERHHRFIGWTALFLTWSFTIANDLWDPSTQTWDLSGRHLVKQQDFWYVMGMTTFIVLPWICTREVEVDIELPSPKVAIIRFKRGMQQGLLGRISRSAVKEYHAFGIISEGPHAKYHYMICGVQGDFTRSLVNDPPRTLWTRELKVGVIYSTLAAAAYALHTVCRCLEHVDPIQARHPYLHRYRPRSGPVYLHPIPILVSTSFDSVQENLDAYGATAPRFLIWIGSDQEKTFGPTISSLIHRHIEPERLLLWDSKQRGGRPDTMKLLKEVYDRWEAEVVFITSNYIGNSEMMQATIEPLCLQWIESLTTALERERRLIAVDSGYVHIVGDGIAEDTSRVEDRNAKSVRRICLGETIRVLMH
ncbi:hypothetical protein EIP86_002263 [Pleurotus ostreatoroseus]|nr:hypothetical protein EIP86_002263 [Pleurotus ostreatoroseus]